MAHAAQQEAPKFTDQDLLDDPTLLELATHFARNYSGDFTFLVHAHGLALTAPLLPLGVARGVLNVMRNDPQARALLPDSPVTQALPTPAPAPPRLQLVPDLPAPAPAPAQAKPLPTPTPTPTPTPPRPSAVVAASSAAFRNANRVPVKAVFKRRWLYSTHPSATVAHIVDREKSKVFYDRVTNRLVYQIECTCRRPRYPAHLVQLVDTPPDGHTECARCLEMDARPTRRRSPR